MSDNKESKSFAYAQAGVNVEAGYKAVELMKRHVARTFAGCGWDGAGEEAGAGVIGGFGGAFPLSLEGIEQPVLVSGTDGVGTKIRIAQLAEKPTTIGIDCVAMCANDIVCTGARPLFFLDYIACGKNTPQKIADIVQGVAEGCVEAGCALIGGETAEHPGIMSASDYDLAGFCVGIVSRKKMLDPKNVQVGDLIIALPSTGLHSNGYSLVRHVLDVENTPLDVPVDALGKKPLGEVLLEPTAIYVKPVLALLEKVQVKSIAHITGGGFYENIPRALPKGLSAVITRSSLYVPPIFTYVQKMGNISERDMFNTFNMGVGMCVIVSAHEADCALVTLAEAGLPGAYVMGEVRKAQDGHQVEFL